MLSESFVIFPGVSAPMSIGTQNYRASLLSWVTHLHFFHLFIFIYLYFHLRMFSDGSVIFPGVSASMSIGMQNLSFLRHPEVTDL